MIAIAVIVDMTNSQVLFAEGLDAGGEATVYPTLAGYFVLLVVGCTTALSSHVLSLFRGTPSNYA